MRSNVMDLSQSDSPDKELCVRADDIRSQVVGRCMAGANSPLSSATLGLQKFVQAGIPARQLILGIPWCVTSTLPHVLSALVNTVATSMVLVLT